MRHGALLLKGLCFLFVVFFSFAAYGAPIPNEDCMGCHGEKDLTGKGPGGKTISLFFHKENFEKSVHNALQCVKCHQINEVPHEAKVKTVSCRTCHESSFNHYRSSVHGAGKGGAAACKDCHGHHDVVKAKNLTSSLCASCHGSVSRQYEEGVHGRGIKSGKQVATCGDCHGKTHDMLRKNDPKSPVYARNLPGTCSRCHADPELIKKYKIPEEKVYTLYMDSIHGRALTKSGILVSAACNDCHGSHDIKTHKDPTSRIYPSRLAATCGQCHKEEEDRFKMSKHGQEVKKGNKNAPTCAVCHPAHQVQPVKATTWMLEAIKECGACHRRPLETYRHSYHGKITNLGFTRVAKCADCHGAHEVLPKSDPRSMISEKHVEATCRKCHLKAGKGFTGFVVHADYRHKGDHPIFYYIWIFMTGLLIVVFGFFGLHTILWLPRSWIERVKERKKKRAKR